MDTPETTLYHAVLIMSLALVLVFLFFGVIIFRTQRRHFRVQRNLFMAEIELLEKERARIARDLHDDLGPLLSLTAIQVREAIEEKDPVPLLRMAAKNIDELYDRLSGIARNLKPGTLLKKGLDETLRYFFEQYQLVLPIRFTYSYDAAPGLPDQVSLHVLRMIQELVSNAVKHSKASVIEVGLKQKGKKLYISCKDNGTGWADTPGPYHGIGLHNLAYRVEMTGGKMRFSNDNGTDYFFEIPIK